MVRRRRTNKPGTRGQIAFGVRIVGVGLCLLLFPFFLRHTPLGAGLQPLRAIGLLLIAAGGVVTWLQRDAASANEWSAEIDKARCSNEPPRPLRRAHGHLPPVDRTSRELERHVEDETKSAAPPPMLSEWSAVVFDVIEWRRFEATVEALFAQAGFETKSQSHGADEGIDIWLYARTLPDRPVSVVQCKHWQGKRVGVDKVRELRGVMAAKGVERGQFATTSSFTRDAATFAGQNGINLLDVQGLLGLIGKRTPDQRQALLKVAFEGEYWKPTCVNCGVKLTERRSRTDGNPFWGCPNYPHCRTTMSMRGKSQDRVL